MVKGVAIKFKSYAETVPKFLSLVKFENEVKKHQSIVLIPSLKGTDSLKTAVDFVEEIVKFCQVHKSPAARVLIAAGADGEDTMEVFRTSGYTQLAERQGISLVDLNTSEVEEIRDGEFLRFGPIYYPKLLLDSYIVVVPRLAEDEETEMQASLSTMLAAFPGNYYRGLFSSTKNRLRKHSLKYAIHDIMRCRMPQLAIVDASEYGSLLLGKPIEIDKQAAKLLGKNWKTIAHLRLVDESFSQTQKVIEAREHARAAAKNQQTAE
ncbi:MAG TPA: DUF362 domain-containing protein [Candidatus Nanoarchaeia archaeon]|nr:DUF362 domain-containing protein [Candidatus Nanoarchaeia archaeon]